MTYRAADCGTYKFVPKTGGGWRMPATSEAEAHVYNALRELMAETLMSATVSPGGIEGGLAKGAATEEGAT